ncbi:hypothetical protein Poli38472_011498 [Pythium oligandrum]|uniref:trypsin n=1 Tax=Pythium oligandrum TaxID=41045 RepID=A0A8K1FNG2_PYTOL|nr:hypothetical protein Poli38472_011498 [Pythium oligandrum]|eukprot:TMW64618.1 hypothetical protein Poli38472_011498 [Pythium oligandrum]
MSVANSTTIPFDQLPNNASSSVRSVHVVALNGPLPSNVSYSVTLPLKTPYPIYLTADQNALLVSIDMATLHVTSIPGVIFVDDSSCAHSVCALPLAVDERVAHTEPHQWSFLLTRDKEDRAYRLLGVGGGPVSDPNGIWGFEWLPQALTTSSLMSHDIRSVKTVLSVNKEIYNGKNVKTTSEYTEFIAGLRTAKNGPMLCGGALIAPKWVLTSAGCTKYRPTVVVIDTLPSRGEPTEVFTIKQTIPHPSYRPTGHSHNFMLVQLDRPSSRRPIKYNQNKDNTPVSAMATAFGYGATSYRSKELNDRLRSMKVEVLGAPYCPEKLSPWLDATTMCVKKQLCYGDYGGPVITDAWSDQRVLFGIISNDFYCRNKHDSNIVGRVSAVAEWINTLLK